jgi:hypothetical protein
MAQGHERTMAEFMAIGIRTIEELKQALQLALRLEFATIPPYLCARWSIREDPDRVEGMIHGVVSQEMKHLAIVGNVLCALGGIPRLYYKSFYPRYPLRALPGGVKLKRPLTLAPLSFEQMRVFLDIERPEHDGVLGDENTIGSFYECVIAGLTQLNPDLVPSSQIPLPFELPITSLSDAIQGLENIKREGEGLPFSPEEPPGDELVYAHFYTFKQIYLQRRLVRVHDE